MRDLCGNGAELDVTDRFNGGKKPLELAVEYGRAGIAEILVRHGASLDDDVYLPSANPCPNPFRFFWRMKENASGREANDEAIYNLLRP